MTDWKACQHGKISEEKSQMLKGFKKLMRAYLATCKGNFPQRFNSAHFRRGPKGAPYMEDRQLGSLPRRHGDGSSQNKLD